MITYGVQSRVPNSVGEKALLLPQTVPQVNDKYCNFCDYLRHTLLNICISEEAFYKKFCQ